METKEKARFPIFAAGEEVCFKCASTLEQVRPSGFAPKHGALRGLCPKCGISAWFDRREVRP